MAGRSRTALAFLLSLATITALAGCGAGPEISAPTPVATDTTASALSTPTTVVVSLSAPTLPAATIAAATVPPINAVTATLPATVAPAAPTAAPAKNFAPDIPITDSGKWFNSQPLTLVGLRGKPVFLVFWSDI